MLGSSRRPCPRWSLQAYLAVVPPLVLHHHLEQIRAKGKLIGGAVSPSAARTSASDAWTATSQPGSVVKVPNSRSLEHQYRRVGRSHRRRHARRHPRTVLPAAHRSEADTSQRRGLPPVGGHPVGARTAKLRQAGARNRSRGKAESRARAALRSGGDSREVSLSGESAFEPLPGVKISGGSDREGKFDRPTSAGSIPMSGGGTRVGTPVIESYLKYEEVGDCAASARGLDQE